MSKKILAILLSLSMIGSAVSMPVFADEIEADIAEMTETVEAEETEEASVPYAEDEIISEETESIETEESNEKNEFDNIWNVALMATEETSIEQPIEKDQTYSFENIDIVAHNITGLSNYLDYVIYYKDGSVSTYQWNQRPSTLSIPAGGKVIMTSISNTIKAVYADEYFLVDEKNKPAMNKVTIGVYETYIYTNTSSVAYKILSSGSSNTYDYVMYDADGNITDYVYNTSSYEIEVPSKYSLKITQTYSTRTFNGVYESFELTKNDEPAMKKAVISTGETYTYTNISNVAYKILSSGSSNTYDYVMYDADGNITDYVYNTSSYQIEVPAKYSVRITQTYSSRTFNGVYESFELTKDDEPVMKKTVVSTGETYTYTNTSNATYKILSSGSSNTYDYVLYYSNDKVKETVSKTSSYSVEVPAGGKIVITQVYSSRTFNGLHEIFDVTDTTSSKKSYKITNVDTVDAVAKYKSGYSGDYAIYDANNKLSTYDVRSNANITIPKGGYAIVTANNTSSTNPFEDNTALSITTIANPVYKTTYLNPNETYKYTNNGSRELKIFKNGLSCDYLIYNADGSIASYAANSTAESFTVPIGGSICVTSHVYLNLKGLYDDFNVEKIADSVFDIAFVSLGDTYQFTNNAVKDINLLLSNSVYDYVIYGADNSPNTLVMNSSSNSITVPSGSRCVVTPQVSNISIYALKKAFTISKRSYPVLKRIPVYFGTSITVTNIQEEDRTLYSSTRNYIDYVTYDAGNNPQKAEELVTPSSITVPASGKAEIKARASNETFGGLYEAFSDEDFSIKVTGVELSQSTLTLAPNKQAILKATVIPTDATNKTVTWSSSNTNVAVVAQTGKVTAKAVGTATITATTADGGYTASCVVTVSDGTTPISSPTPTQKPDEPTPPVADGAVVKVSSVTASAGNTVNVTVDLSGNKGFANLGIQVGYDANNLTLTSVTNNASVGATYTGAQSITANPYNMGWDSTSNITYNGNLATLTFKVKENAAEGTYPITVSYYKGIGGNYTDGEDVNYDADFNSLGLSYVNGAITVSSHIAGDINGDGKVNNQDGTFLLRHLAGWNVNIDESALDVNGDGKVNNQDGTVLLRYLAGWSVTIH